MRLNEAILRYIEYLYIERGLSELSVKHYARNLSRLVEFLGDKKVAKVE